MYHRLIVLFVAILLTWGCGKKEDRAVAKVNGQKITLGQLESSLKGSTRAGQPVTGEVWKQGLERRILMTVLLQEADRTGLLKDEILLQRIERERERMILEEVIRRRITPFVTVSDEEIQKYYEETYRKKETKPLPLDQVREPLRRQIIQAKERESFSTLTKGLRSKAKVSVYEDILKTAGQAEGR